MDHRLFRKMAAYNWRLSLIAGAIVAPVLAVGTASSARAVISCPTAIKACGCQIKKKGTYSVTADLNAAQGLTPDGDCIELKASRVTLNLNSHQLTGPGGSSSDVGIDIRSGSNYDSIDGGSPDATISGWKTGVESSGKDDTLTGIDASSNSLDGIEINQGNNNQLTSWSASNNGAFGAWIKQGSGNSLSQGSANGNGKDGVFVGCSAGGLAGEDCPGEGQSRSNDLHDDSADSNGEYGIALDTNSSGTTLDTVSGSSNGSDDLLDDSCSGDSLSGDSFGNSSNSCPGGSDS